jgi:hypothetical protein
LLAAEAAAEVLVKIISLAVEQVLLAAVMAVMEQLLEWQERLIQVAAAAAAVTKELAAQTHLMAALAAPASSFFHMQ